MPDALAFDEKDTKSQQSQLQKENEKKQNELAKTKQTLQEKIKYSENLQQRISDLSSRINQSNDKIKSLNKKIKERNKLIDNINGQLYHLDGQISRMNDSISCIQNRRHSLQEEYASIHLFPLDAHLEHLSKVLRAGDITVSGFAPPLPELFELRVQLVFSSLCLQGETAADHVPLICPKHSGHKV